MSYTLRMVTLAAVSIAFVCLPATVAADKGGVKYVSARPVCSLDGKVLYDAYCAVCHGKDGRGAGPAAKFLSEPVPDLTQLASNNSGKFNELGVSTDVAGRFESHANMPSWEKFFSDGFGGSVGRGQLATHNIVHHVEALQASHPVR